MKRYNVYDIEEYRGEKKKNNFMTRKSNTLKSLKEVEIFLNNWKNVFNGIKLYKILK